MIFSFKYERSIDPKQRLPIPADIREGLDPEADGEAFYVIEGPNGALWLWPERTFERMAGDIEAHGGLPGTCGVCAATKEANGG